MKKIRADVLKQELEKYSAEIETRLKPQKTCGNCAYMSDSGTGTFCVLRWIDVDVKPTDKACGKWRQEQAEKTCGNCSFIMDEGDGEPYCVMQDLYTFVKPTDKGCEMWR